MFNFFKKTKKVFGLDISGDALKLVQLTDINKTIKFKAFSKTYFPKGMIINDTISDLKIFEHLLKQTLNQPQYGDFDTKDVVVSLPESKAFVRVIQIPNMSDEEAENAIPFEAESFIPMPIEQVYLDWKKISTIEDKMNVIIIASPKEFVDKYLDMFDKFSLNPLAFEVESQSCLRSLLPGDSKETLLIADIQAFRSNLIMVEEGQLQFTSSVPIAGNAFTEAIARTLGVSTVKAEEIKKKVGIANAPEYPNIKTATLPVLSSLAGEISGILKFHAGHSNKTVSKIVFSGGSSRLTHLIEFFEKDFPAGGGMRIELGNPLFNLTGLKDSPMNPNEALSYAIAIGLALRGIG